MKKKEIAKQKAFVVGDRFYLLKIVYSIITSLMIKLPFHCQSSSFLLTFPFSLVPCWTTILTFLEIFGFTLITPRT